MAQPVSLPSLNGGSATLDVYPLRGDDHGGSIAEGSAYKFVYRGSSQLRSISPSEIFVPDPDDPCMGRLQPMNHVGTIGVVVDTHDGTQDRFEFEVAPARLSDDSDYRALLEQVADFAAEAVLQGFAPAHRMLAADPDSLGDLDYRALAFIAARLRDESFQAAVAQILRRPHRRWQTVDEDQPLGRGSQSGARLVRQLTRGGGRMRSAPEGLRQMGLSHVPESVTVQRTDTTFDTNPNRVIRFILSQWQSIGANLEHRLSRLNAEASGPRTRGLAEARWVVQECDRILSSDVLRDVGPLRSFPHGDPVLLRQPGYREVLRAFALSEASLTLRADLDDDLFAATMRNTATLYEYWTFLVLVQCLTELCGESVDGTVFTSSRDGLSLVLRHGQASKLSWVHSHAGRDLAVDLWFNRSFSQGGTDNEMASWASAIRPDASMRLRPLTGRPRDVDDPQLDAWVHFDAKFRLDLGSAEVVDDDPVSTVKRTDLLKMHAYRDLIRRSAGAYVLYPGNGGKHVRSEFHEVLPGIGAFPLRPAAHGAVSGVDDLRGFLSETLELAANQASAHERSRFWQARHTVPPPSTVKAVNFLDLPPADEPVLIGYVRADQLPWVRSRRRYNLRADGRTGTVQATDEALAARLVLLWTRDDGEPTVLGLFERTGPWQIATAAEMWADRYPRRESAQAYLVSAINPVTSNADTLLVLPNQLPLPADAAPELTTWDRIAASWA